MYMHSFIHHIDKLSFSILLGKCKVEREMLEVRVHCKNKILK